LYESVEIGRKAGCFSVIKYIKRIESEVKSLEHMPVDFKVSVPWDCIHANADADPGGQKTYGSYTDPDPDADPDPEH
jgi:hypothetical protein